MVYCKKCGAENEEGSRFCQSCGARLEVGPSWGGEEVSGFVDTWKKVVLSPEEFFSQMPTSGGFEDPLKFLVIVLVIAGIGAALIGIATGGPFGVFAIVAYPIFGLIGAFIVALVVHICFMIVGGKGDFEATFRVISFSEAPSVVGWLPIVGFFASLYSLYLAIVGGSYAHEISRGRSAVAVLIPIILLVILVILLAIVFGIAIIRGILGG